MMKQLLSQNVVFGSNHSSLAQHFLNFGMSRTFRTIHAGSRPLRAITDHHESQWIQNKDDMMQKCLSFLDMARKGYGALHVSQGYKQEHRLVHRRRRKTGDGDDADL